MAGKTGTTENYGDAWFVGYTPQLVMAVWVGYPNKLRPMLTEFDGEPVAGGTYPALIWKSFMEQALPYLHDGPESFAPPLLPYCARRSSSSGETGSCSWTTATADTPRQVLYFSGRGPARTADCKANEVDVPHVVGARWPRPTRGSRAQPLTPRYVYEPATPEQRLGIVLRQFPAKGTLSSYDKVTLVCRSRCTESSRTGRPAARAGDGAAASGSSCKRKRRRARSQLAKVICAEPARSHRRDAGHGGQARGSGRLRKREPART